MQFLVKARQRSRHLQGATKTVPIVFKACHDLSSDGVTYRGALRESPRCNIQMTGKAAMHSRAIAQKPAGPKRV